MNGQQLVTSLKKKFGVTKDKKLAAELGVSQPKITQWKNTKKISTRQVANLVYEARNAIKSNSIKPIVEFYPIDWSDSEEEEPYEVFPTKGGQNLFLDGLKNELNAHRGIYIFYDSRGHAIYVGRTHKQNIWKEMHNAYNRPRGEIQSIKRIRHPDPARNQHFKTSEEKTRQITRDGVRLWEIAFYFSAYQVADGMIKNMEALLIRSFANDILNKKVEKFGKT